MGERICLVVRNQILSRVLRTLKYFKKDEIIKELNQIKVRIEETYPINMEISTFSEHKGSFTIDIYPGFGNL